MNCFLDDGDRFMTRARVPCVLTVLATIAACSSSEGERGPWMFGAETGGASTGRAGTGGRIATGGRVATGGAATGGRIATGGRVSTGGAATGGVATGGRVTTGGAATGGITTGGRIAAGGAATGGVATGGGVSTGGAPAGGAAGGVASGGVASGGVSVTSTGGSGTGGATACSTVVTSGKDYTHPVYGHGYIFGDATSNDYWITFDSNLHYDRKTGFGWHPTDGSLTQQEAITQCAASTIANLSWKLVTIGQLRLLADGCPSTVTGGTCELQDSCLTYSCGFNDGCGSCRGGDMGSGPANCEYCRANVRLCYYSHTLSNCPDCVSHERQTEWTYNTVNGNFDVMDPTVRIVSLCVATSVPDF